MKNPIFGRVFQGIAQQVRKDLLNSIWIKIETEIVLNFFDQTDVFSFRRDPGHT